MSSFRLLALCTGTAFLIGAGAGYWSAQSSSTEKSALTRSNAEPVLIMPAALEGSRVSGTSLAPTPLSARLVGTIVDTAPSKSKAWIQETSSAATQAFSTGDSLLGGYKIESIGPDMVTISKDGQQQILRRNASASASAESAVASRSSDVARSARANEYGLSENKGNRARENRIGGASGVRTMSAKTVAAWADPDQKDEAEESLETPATSTAE